jgi:hypothetical protein
MMFNGCPLLGQGPSSSITCHMRSLFWRSKLLGVERVQRDGTRCSQILPTRELRREYKTIATAEANFTRVVAYHIRMLKSFGV